MWCADGNRYTTSWGRGHMNDEDNKMRLINHQPKNFLNHSILTMVAPTLDATIETSKSFVEDFQGDAITDEYVDHAWKFICGQKAKNDILDLTLSLDMDEYKEKLFEIIHMKKTPENKKFVCSKVQILLNQLALKKNHPEYEKYNNRYQNLLTKFQ